jgi:hypothetical protein
LQGNWYINKNWMLIIFMLLVKTEDVCYAKYDNE